MPNKKTIDRVKKMAAEGKSPSAQAGEFVREQIDDIRDGKHGARSTKQAIAIGLSEARRAGVKLPPPKKGKYSEETRDKAIQETKKVGEPISKTRSKASSDALKKEPKVAASHEALSRHAKAVAKSKSPEERSEIAKKAAKTRKQNGT